EEALDLTLAGAIDHFTRTPPRGEFTLILEGTAVPGRQDMPSEKAAVPEAAIRIASQARADGASLKEAARAAAAATGVSRRDIYNELLQHKQERP
ncbi:MAG: hypothetical protein FWG93_01885, partial [Oscillospiraceae bacterium]|nr:hypothetical protein [Oscillospiraceae bacterium]